MRCGHSEGTTSIRNPWFERHSLPLSPSFSVLPITDNLYSYFTVHIPTAVNYMYCNNDLILLRFSTQMRQICDHPISELASDPCIIHKKLQTRGTIHRGLYCVRTKGQYFQFCQQFGPINGKIFGNVIDGILDFTCLICTDLVVNILIIHNEEWVMIPSLLNSFQVSSGTVCQAP